MKIFLKREEVEVLLKLLLSTSQAISFLTLQREMTHEEKAALCAKVAQASPKQIGQVVVTIHKCMRLFWSINLQHTDMPGIFKGTGSEVQEVDINIDLLSVAALREIAAILAESS